MSLRNAGSAFAASTMALAAVDHCSPHLAMAAAKTASDVSQVARAYALMVLAVHCVAASTSTRAPTTDCAPSARAHREKKHHSADHAAALRACPHLSHASAHTSCNPAEKLRAV